jgi:hypothetical protein
MGLMPALGKEAMPFLMLPVLFVVLGLPTIACLVAAALLSRKQFTPRCALVACGAALLVIEYVALALMGGWRGLEVLWFTVTMLSFTDATSLIYGIPAVSILLSTIAATVLSVWLLATRPRPSPTLSESEGRETE